MAGSTGQINQKGRNLAAMSAGGRRSKRSKGRPWGRPFLRAPNRVGDRRCRLLRHLRRAGLHVVEAADVEERLLGQVVGLAVADRVEAAQRVLDGRVDALLAGELLGHEERLAEEPLDL